MLPTGEPRKPIKNVCHHGEHFSKGSAFFSVYHILITFNGRKRVSSPRRLSGDFVEFDFEPVAHMRGAHEGDLQWTSDLKAGTCYSRLISAAISQAHCTAAKKSIDCVLQIQSLSWRISERSLRDNWERSLVRPVISMAVHSANRRKFIAFASCICYVIPIGCKRKLKWHAVK